MLFTRAASRSDNLISKASSSWRALKALDPEPHFFPALCFFSPNGLTGFVGALVWFLCAGPLFCPDLLGPPLPAAPLPAPPPRLGPLLPAWSLLRARFSVPAFANGFGRDFGVDYGPLFAEGPLGAGFLEDAPRGGGPFEPDFLEGDDFEGDVFLTGRGIVIYSLRFSIQFVGCSLIDWHQHDLFNVDVSWP